jgi:hypothetical protein
MAATDREMRIGGSIYRAARLGFQANGWTAAILGIRAQGHAAPIRLGRWGRQPWRPARLPRPHAIRHGEEDREKQRWGKRADRWTPHVSGCVGFGRWELGCGLRWAERCYGPAGWAGRKRKVGVALQTLVEWVKAQN